MAVTETPHEMAPEASESATVTPRGEPTGLAAVLGSGDHKVLGRLFIVASLIFGVIVLTLGEAFGVESLKPATLDIFSSDNAAQLFSLARLGAVFLLALPLTIGVAFVVVPLQVGARSIAFPRAAAASFWGWLLGGALLVASYIANGGPGATDEVSAKGVNLWIAAMGLLVLSILLAATSLATTVFALRPAGMRLSRIPMYAWSIAVASVLWLLTLPVLFGLIVLMYVDHRHAGGISVGDPGSMYGSLEWLLRNPQIYVVAIPILGFVVDVLATASGSRVKSRSVAQTAIVAFGIFSFGAFLVAPSQDGLESALVVVLALVAVVPILAVASTVGDRVLKTGFAFNASVLYALAALVMLLLGTVAAAAGAIPGVLDIPESGTVGGNIFSLGVSHAILLAALTASLGGITWWATKIGRQPANDKVAMLAPLVLLGGTVLTVIPDLVAGLTGEGAELTADYTGGLKGLNIVTLIGLGVVGIGLIIALVSLLPLIKKPEGEIAADPWGGQTLEWLTASPPSLANFDTDLAAIVSAEPLIDLREEK